MGQKTNNAKKKPKDFIQFSSLHSRIYLYDFKRLCSSLSLLHSFNPSATVLRLAGNNNEKSQREGKTEAAN